ncbi:MAG: protein kinase [Proteobacteria bacterium]|nr:protein kinase [Pseudomonadota bacterium]
MITHPRTEELTEAVARWVDSIRPQLGPREAFLARVAANVLGVVGRELTLGPAAQAAATDRLIVLLDHGGGYAELNSELCQRLREGTMDATTPGLLAALKANVLDQLAIDQPNYRHE